MTKKILLSILLLIIMFGIAAADRPRVGLVLGGGGAKGFAHIAVLELLEEMEIPVDLIIGVSSGAIVGGLYAAGYNPQMIKDAVFNLDWPSFFLQDTPVSYFEKELDTGNLLLRYSLEKGKPVQGLSSGQIAYNLIKTLTVKIPSYIDFDMLPIPFRAGAVVIPEGRVELIRGGDMAEAVRASLGIPGVFEPFDIDGKLYIDGGTLDNLPVRQAREMGCDIVIASELFSRPESIGTSMLEIPDLILDLFLSNISSDQHEYADAVLFANEQGYSAMDFQKSEEIYTLVRAQKERMRPKLEKIKELLASETESPAPRPSYNDMPFLEPLSLNIIGALARDKTYIENLFSRFVRGKALEASILEDFIIKVYETGNYQSVTARMENQQGIAILELHLHQKIRERTVFLFGGNYQGTFSRETINKLSIQLGLEVYGLSGPGSILFLNSSWVELLSLGALYLQPLSPRTFITAQAEVKLDNDIIVSFFPPEGAEKKSLFLVSAETEGGIYLDRRTVLKAGALFFLSDPHIARGEESRNMALGLGTAFRYDSLDNQLIPARGFYSSLENQLFFPLPFADPWYYDILALDLKGVLPLSSKFHVLASFFAGSDLSLNLSRLEGIPAGFTAFDRQYFPHISGTGAYYSHKAAASLAFQFQPRENLTVLGGQLLTSLSFSAGTLLDKWEDFTIKGLLWNASFNAGLLLRNNFGLLLRAGAGSNGSAAPVPFLAFDIGQAAKSGIKPMR